jgi:hypothetical protein
MDQEPAILKELLTALRNATRGSTLVLDQDTLSQTSAAALLDLFSQQLQITSFTLDGVSLPDEVTGSSFAASGHQGDVTLDLTFTDVLGEVATEALFRAQAIETLREAFTELPDDFFAGIEASGSTATVGVPGLVSPLTLSSARYGITGLVTPNSGLVTTSIAPHADGMAAAPDGPRVLSVEIETKTTGYRVAPTAATWTFADLGWLLSGLAVLGAFPEIIPTSGLALRGFSLSLYTFAALSSVALDVADATDPSRPLWSAADGKVELTDVIVSLALTYAEEDTLELAGTGSVQGNFRLGTIALTAQVPFPVTGIWSLTAYPNVPLPTLSDIATLVTGGLDELNEVLPARLGEIGRFEFSYLRIAVDAGSFSLAEFTFAVSSAAPWRLIPDVVELESLRMSLTVDGTPSVTGTVIGTLRLPDGAGIIVSVGRGTPREQWRLDAVSPAIALPSLGELTQLARDEDLAALVKAGGLDRLRFVMTNLNFGMALAPPPATLTNLGLRLQLANAADPLTPVLDWDLIPDVLTLTGFSFGFQLDWSGTESSKRAFGTFVLNGLEFGIRFASQTKAGADADALIAEYSAQGAAGTVSIRELIASIAAPDIANTVPEGLVINLADAMLAYLNTDGKKKFLFAMDIAVELPVSGLPIIGNALPRDATVGIKNLKVVVASDPLSAKDVALINRMSPVPVLAPPAAGADGEAIPAGFSMTAELELEALSILMTSPPVRKPADRAVAAPEPAGQALVRRQASAPDPVMWVQVQKTFGPVQVQKVGFSYQDGGLFVLSNLSLTVGGLEIDLIGIGIGSPIRDPRPEFTIQGLAVSFDEGPISIRGGLLGRLDPPDFVGVLSVKVPEFSLSAFGGYAEYQDHPSFFLYGVLHAPIGGPPAFFVTGIAAGAGFNRKLLIPDVSGVATFPLVAWAQGNGTPSMDPSKPIGGQVKDVLERLSRSGVVAPSVGEYWFAAGVQFTSFEIIESFALLTVGLGASVEIALLGLSTLTIPPMDPEPVAQIQLAIEVAFSADKGLLAIAGQLTSDSYVLSRKCRLTGGFAFYLWFAGDLAGETVLTLGGYNPNFTVPGYYPVVPRVGLNWQVIPQLGITGELYFALTPNVVMAGGKLSAVWNSGAVSAWFTYWADFLMTFSPFHYYIDGGIDLGAKFTVHLLFCSVCVTIHIGVAIELWGPSFAGRAKVDLSIISFTIAFGNGQPDTSTSIPWPKFVSELLPGQSPARRRAIRGRPVVREDPPDKAAAVVRITVTSGLVSTLDPVATGPVYLVTPETFQCAVLTVIPNKHVHFLPDPDPSRHGLVNLDYAPDSEQPLDPDGNPIVPNTDFGAGPAGLAPAVFQPAITMSLSSSTDSVMHAYRRFSNAPKALWEKKKFANGVPEVDPVTGLTDASITDALTGFALIPYLEPDDRTLPVPLESLLATRGRDKPFGWSTGVPPRTNPFSDQTVTDTIDTPVVSGVRRALLDALAGQGITVDTNVNVRQLADRATTYLEAAPRLRLLGGPPPLVAERPRDQEGARS